jgi:SAM-dependent methyltransferase
MTTRCNIVSEHSPDFGTDAEWDEWGRRDPYFAVITQSKFRLNEITEQAKSEFFASGQAHVEYVLQTIRGNIDAGFAPKSILDFGCGVGRTLIPFARIAKNVVGLDVSAAMLQEARNNCREQCVTNVTLISSDDSLSTVPGEFDLVHSFIVFQHIPADRGRLIFRNLLNRLASGGVGAIHVLYSKSDYAPTCGMGPATSSADWSLRTTQARSDEPEMQMNPYSMNELLWFVQAEGVQRFHADFTDHGGELGVFLFFQAPV